ncbi:hypothetical protein [Ramlibacter pallidus]|uniref:Uncharacterized protein n=1 Tax=Ramlibacter pallidus TaxID=2780087 RepID=A0ABR9S4V1_9BURK|nr:hypothetical protein [Ramlibacter pallidus]MBE7368545.1 hypothetical protein [Ramlibacter pallidus]
MFGLLMGKKSAPAAKAPRPSGPAASMQFGHSQATQSGGSVNSIRKDVLRVALRDLMLRNGIPATWLSAEMLRTSTSQKDAGMHMRFLVRHWEPRLMLHAPALEQDFLHRLNILDPQASKWLVGMSWQFALDDRSICPPLPHANSWTAPEPRPDPTQPAPISSHGDIIEGPVMIPKPQEDVRADLERLLALRDDDMRRHHAPAKGDGFAPTRPASL